MQYSNHIKGALENAQMKRMSLPEQQELSLLDTSPDDGRFVSSACLLENQTLTNTCNSTMQF
jgi:hypothetical protein